MSKKIMKRSLALGALMAFVITGSAWAEVTKVGAEDYTYGGGWINPKAGETFNISSHTFNNDVDAKSLIGIDGATTNITNTTFSGAGSKNIILLQYGSTLNLRDVTFNWENDSKPWDSRNYINNNGTVDTNVNFEGNNDLSGMMSRGIYWGKGTLTFKSGSETTIEASSNNKDITNRSGGRIIVENGAVLNLEHSGIDLDFNGDPDVGYVEIAGTLNGDIKDNDIEINNGGILNGNVTGTSTINLNGGTLNGRVYKFYGTRSTVEFNGGTWNMTGDSVVAGIDVKGDAVIAGTVSNDKDIHGDGRSVLSFGENIDATRPLINHLDGDLKIQDVTLKNINHMNKIPQNFSGTVLHSYDENSNIDGSIEISNCAVTDNINKYGSGVIFVHGNTLDVTDSEFRNNSVAVVGGALMIDKDTASNLKDSIFNGNKAGLYGGAIYLCDSKTKVEGKVEFSDNEAESGAAIYNDIYEREVSILTFDGEVTFKDNIASNEGGAIYNKSVVNFNVGTAIFNGNIADGEANDIYNVGTININQGAKVSLDGGITGSGTTNINGGNLVLGSNNKIGTLKVTDSGKIVFGENGHLDVDVIDESSDIVTLTMAEKTADDLSTLEDLTSVAKKMGVAESYKSTDKVKVVMEAGTIVGKTTGEVEFVTKETEDGVDYYHGVVKNKIEQSNPANQAISDAGVGLKLHYRYHMNDMNKRMGELRNANGEHGVWTRMVRGECEYENSKAQYNQYQLGYDEKLSVDKRWTVGAAVTFSEGDSSYGYGSTEDKSTAFAIYGSKLNNDGTFVDLIARYAHLESDIEDKAGKGDYSTNGMSVSAEFGKRIQQGNGLWIEPQFELTYGNFDSAEFQIGGKTVQVGDMDSLIGRIGFSLGKDIKQGNVYARASYLYDFDGETETAFSNASATRTFKDDLGGGWWEVGVGANINLSKATYIYADVEKTFGGEVDTNWQWNLGVRYSF